MAVISKSFEANVAATQLVNVTNTEQFFDTIISFNGYVGCVVQIYVDFVATPTDDLVVSVYLRQNGTNFDNIPFFQFTIDKGTDPARPSFILDEGFEARVGVKASGATDTEPSVDMNTRRWNYTSV